MGVIFRKREAKEEQNLRLEPLEVKPLHTLATNSQHGFMPEGTSCLVPNL